MAPLLNNERIPSHKTGVNSSWAQEVITPGNPGEADENSILYPALIVLITQGDAAVALLNSTLRVSGGIIALQLRLLRAQLVSGGARESPSGD